MLLAKAHSAHGKSALPLQMPASILRIRTRLPDTPELMHLHRLVRDVHFGQACGGYSCFPRTAVYTLEACYESARAVHAWIPVRILHMFIFCDQVMVQCHGHLAHRCTPLRGAYLRNSGTLAAQGSKEGMAEVVHMQNVEVRRLFSVIVHHMRDPLPP